MENYKNLSLEDIVYIDDNGVTCVEQWKDIPDYEGLYQASNLGRIKSLKKPRKKSTNNPNSFVRERIMKASLSQKYLNTGLYKDKYKQFLVHHLIALSFMNFKANIGNIVIDHKNNISTDNRLVNLQLISRRNNNNKDAKNKTGAIGVYTNKGFYYARINFNGKNYNLGSFKNVLDAKNKYLEAYNLIENNQNIFHLLKIRSNKTNYKGVYKSNKKFTTQIRYLGYTRNLGSYNTSEEASKIYELAQSLIKNNKSIEHLIKKKKSDN
jgi:hypothetical protein